MKATTLPLVLVLALAGLSPAQAQEEAPWPHISVTGTGEASVSPDMAMLTLSVMREAETARAALDAENAAMADVIAAMKEAGVTAKDLQTSDLSIDPQYNQPTEKNQLEKREIVGYRATNTLSVRVRDLDKVGALIDRSVSLGVNQGGNIVFTNDDMSKPLEEARRKAVEDAMSRARTLSEAAGVRLGDITEIREQSYSPPMPFRAKASRMALAADAVPVEAGENTYRVEVVMSFGIEQ